MLKISVLSHSRSSIFIGLDSGTTLNVVKCCQSSSFCNLFTGGERLRLKLKPSGNNCHKIHIGCAVEVFPMLQRTTELRSNSLTLCPREVLLRAFDYCIGQGPKAKIPLFHSEYSERKESRYHLIKGSSDFLYKQLRRSFTTSLTQY